MNKDFYTRLRFKNKHYEVRLIPNGDGFDIEIKCSSRISGDEFQSLKKYLSEEGYFEAAREWCEI